MSMISKKRGSIVYQDNASCMNWEIGESNKLLNGYKQIVGPENCIVNLADQMKVQLDHIETA